MISGPGVPAEFVGKARVFRARVGAEDAAVGQTIQHIMEPPLRTRRRRSATFRPETLIDAERQFRLLPSAGRLRTVARRTSGSSEVSHRWTVADGKMFS